MTRLQSKLIPARVKPSGAAVQEGFGGLGPDKGKHATVSNRKTGIQYCPVMKPNLIGLCCCSYLTHTVSSNEPRVTAACFLRVSRGEVTGQRGPGDLYCWHLKVTSVDQIGFLLFPVCEVKPLSFTSMQMFAKTRIGNDQQFHSGVLWDQFTQELSRERKKTNQI